MMNGENHSIDSPTNGEPSHATKLHFGKELLRETSLHCFHLLVTESWNGWTGEKGNQFDETWLKLKRIRKIIELCDINSTCLNRVVNSYDTTENKRRRRDEEISARVEVFLSSTTVATKSNELDLASNKREREIKSVSSSQSSLSFFFIIACVR